MKLLLTCLFFAFAVPGYSQAPVTAPDVTAAIDQLREGLVTSFKKGDIETLLTYLDADVVVTWQNGEVCHGPEAVRAFYQRMMTGENHIVREIKSDPKVLGRQVHGDVAVSWGNLQDHFVLNDGSDLPLNSVFTATVAKRGDRWLVSSFHTSVNAFENPVLSLAIRKTALWIGAGVGVIALLLGWFAARYVLRKKSAP